MTIRVECPNCGAAFKAPAEAAGRQAKCRKCGEAFTLTEVPEARALRADGTVVAWSQNEKGQTAVPAGLSDVVAIAAGDFHNLALRSDGTIVAWRLNDSGQCTVDPELRYRAVAAGWKHSVGLIADRVRD